MKSLDWQKSYVSMRTLSFAVLIFTASCSGGTTSMPSPSTLTPASASNPGGIPASSVNRGTLAVARAKQPLLQPPPGTIYFGAFVNATKALGPYEAQTALFESQIGRKLAIHAEYHKWTESFPAGEETDDYKNNRLAVVSWDCGATSTDIINGTQDAVITKTAQTFKTFKHLIFLRYFWEMNLPYKFENRPKCIDPTRDTNGLFNAADYVAAWQHIHAIFVAQGATNVVWLWCPSGNVTVDPSQYYPGSTQTDWVGFDHYDVTGNVGFQNTMSGPYAALLPYGQPIMVGETGTTATSQPSFFANAPAIMQANFPNILGLMYYDAYGHRQDWRLTSAGISAFAAAGATQYFSGMGPHK